MLPTVAGVVEPELDPGRGPAPGEDSLLPNPEWPSRVSVLAADPFSTLACGEFSPGFTVPVATTLPPAAPGVAPATVVPALDGPTTNREASSASGTMGAGSRGTLTALMITTAFCVLMSGSIEPANTGALGSLVAVLFGTTGFVVASDNFGLSLGTTGAGGSLGRKVTNASGFDNTGCSSRGATGARMARCGSTTTLGSRSG